MSHFIIENYNTAIFFCFITMSCWGSWANTQKLSSQKWPFQLFYWDYSFGILLITLIFGLTLSSNGELRRSFIDDLSQAELFYMQSAFIGGVVFNLANLLLVIAIEISGMAIAFPIGIGIALVLGVFTNYISFPSGNPLILFGGVLLLALAIIINRFAYKKTLQNNGGGSTKGILFSIAAGIAMGFFYKYVAASMAPDFTSPQAGKLTPYTALFIFLIGVLLSNFLFNTINMYRLFLEKW